MNIFAVSLLDSWFRGSRTIYGVRPYWKAGSGSFSSAIAPIAASRCGPEFMHRIHTNCFMDGWVKTSSPFSLTRHSLVASYSLTYCYSSIDETQFLAISFSLLYLW